MDPSKTMPLVGRGDDFLRFGIHGVKSDIIEPHPLQSARRSVMFQPFSLLLSISGIWIFLFNFEYLWSMKQAKHTHEEMKKKILANTYGAAFPMKMELDRQMLSKFVLL